MTTGSTRRLPGVPTFGGCGPLIRVYRWRRKLVTAHAAGAGIEEAVRIC
jgi:hypothetical protein